MRDVIAERLSTYPTSTRFIEALFDSLGHAISVTKEHEGFYDNFVAEMFELGVLHHDINNLKKVADKYYPQHEIASNDYERANVSGQVMELTRRGIEQRKYGIKSAYI